MVHSRSAVRYAKAILDVAIEKGNADDVNKDMKYISTAIADNEELKRFLENPIYKADAKLDALKEIFQDSTEETKSLFGLLLQNKRFENLEAIAVKFAELYDQYKGVEVAYVTTATALTPELETKVLSKIKELTNKEVTIENIVNPEIVGGFIIRIGDKQFNASISDKLSQLKREFTN